MKANIAYKAILITILFTFIITGSEIAQGASNNFKVIVLVVPSKNFKNKFLYRYDYFDNDYLKGPSAYSIQETLNNMLTSRLNAHQSTNVWEAVFCKTSREFDKKIAETNVYLGIQVEINEYTSEYRNSSLTDHDDSEIIVDCDVHRKSGSAWSKVFSKRLTSKSSETKDKEYFVSSIEGMAESLDMVIINNMVSYQVVGSMSKDIRTKIIKARIMNSSPSPIKSVEWAVPREREILTATTECPIKSGQTADVAVTIQSEKSHAAIQWRNLYITNIEFDTSSK